MDEEVIQQVLVKDPKNDDLDSNLHDVFENAQKEATHNIKHMDDLFKLLHQRYESMLQEKEDQLLDMAAKKDLLLQTTDQNMKKKIAYLMNRQKSMTNFTDNIRQRQNNLLIKSRVLSVWNRLALNEKYQRRLDTLGDKISTNMEKARVFSRFAYNLTSRNYKGKEKQYLRNFDDQSKKLIGRYEQDVGDLQHRLAVAEASARMELSLRQRLEEDIRTMLLKNMSTMNVEAINVLKQPLLLYPLADEIFPPSNKSSNQTVSTGKESTDFISNFKNFFSEIGHENRIHTSTTVKTNTNVKKNTKPKPMNKPPTAHDKRDRSSAERCKVLHH